jgi:hypothetical protein
VSFCRSSTRNKFAAALKKSAPYAAETRWSEKGREFYGFTGLRLTQEALL